MEFLRLEEDFGGKMNIQEKFNKLIKSEDIVEQTKIIDEFLEDTIKLTYTGTFVRDIKQYILELEKCCIYLKVLYKSQEMITPMVHYKQGKIIHHNRLTGLREPKFLYGFFFGLSELLKIKYGLGD